MNLDRPWVHSPLCVLAFDKDIKKVCNYLISWGIGDLSMNVWADTTTEHFQQCAGMMGINIHNLKNTMHQYTELDKFIQAFEEKHGKDQRFRAHKTMILNVRDGYLKPALFLIYAAIRSKLGKKEFVQMSMEEIRRRAAGCRTEAILQAGAGRAELLTTKQIRTSINGLTAKNFILHTTFHRRESFYAVKKDGLNYELLVQKIAAFKIRQIQKNNTVKSREASETLNKIVDAATDYKKRNRRKKAENEISFSECAEM